MLAINHATLATATIMSWFLYFDQKFFLPFIIFGVFAGVFPDIDHPGSELGKWFKPIGKLLPHRGITHSLLGLFIFGFGVNFMIGNNNQYLTYFLIFGACFGVYLLQKILHKNINKIDNLTIGIVSQKHLNLIIDISSFICYLLLFALAVTSWNMELKLQALKVLILGYFAHLIGDFITIEGIPLFYPLKTKLGLKLFRTGSWIEGMVGFVLVIINIYLLYRLNLRDNYLDWNYWRYYLPMLK